MIRLPNNLSNKNIEYVTSAYEYLNNFIELINEDGSINDESNLYLIIKSFSLLRVASGVIGKMDEDNIIKMSKELGEEKEFIENIVILRNDIAHPYDKYAYRGIIDVDTYIKLRNFTFSGMRRYFNGFRNE